jgi:pyrroloquinoline quinone (PQQ) biosynthesis protein C
MNTLDSLRHRIEPLRSRIINHPVYSNIRSLEDVRVFMEQHVYAVWDFMSLLKTLQNTLTCTSVPWFPVGTGDTRQFINEIVLGEECDVDEHGTRMSHFELYLQAMEQCGADTHSIRTFCAVLQQTQDMEKAFEQAHTPPAARQFVRNTFSDISSGKAHVQASVFTFGREDLIPSMFISMVNDLHVSFPERIQAFKYYLERHIEVDGDHHSHLALAMCANLFDGDAARIAEAEEAAVRALEHRILLWDSVHEALRPTQGE